MATELDKQIRLAAEVLRSFGATEVYVFGSAAEGTADAESDVDMAVMGLPAGVFYRA
jgi:predicted nucleotidyltransferase